MRIELLSHTIEVRRNLIKAPSLPYNTDNMAEMKCNLRKSTLILFLFQITTYLQPYTFELLVALCNKSSSVVEVIVDMGGERKQFTSVMTITFELVCLFVAEIARYAVRCRRGFLVTASA